VHAAVGDPVDWTQAFVGNELSLLLHGACSVIIARFAVISEHATGAGRQGSKPFFTTPWAYGLALPPEIQDPPSTFLFAYADRI
jgi:hypothetical protein